MNTNLATQAQTPSPTDAANVAARPLQGFKVVELHAIGPVPFAGRMLADLGAEVVRISPPSDPGLGLPLVAEYDVLNFHKTAKTLDLKSPQGRAALLAELHDADVLLEGFRPGVLERLDCAPATLLQTLPRLVIGRLSGWGDQGDLAPRAGHDINYLALSGALHAIGRADHPVPPLNLVADFGGGTMHLLVGVLAKLLQRSRDGLGGVVTTSILAGTHSLNLMFYGLIAQGQWQLQRESNLLDGGLPFYRCYATACGGHVAVGALEGKFFRELLQVTGLQDQIDAKHQYRREHWAAMTSCFEQTFQSRSRDDWAELAHERDACLAPVLTLQEAAQHPHNRANAWFHDDQIGPSSIFRFA